jgi:hypothetical protein
MRCKDCKYFGKSVIAEKGYDDEHNYEKTEYHLCDLVKHMGRGVHGYVHVHENEPMPAAGVIDGSDYYAAFIVADDFGCVKFEPKEQGS